MSEDDQNFSEFREFDAVDENNYLDIHDILCTQELVTCLIRDDIKNISLEMSDESFVPVEANNRYQLPIWMAKTLQEAGIANIGVPIQFQQIYRDILAANAVVPRLNEFSPYFYSFGLYVTSFNPPDAYFIAEILVKTFRDRFRMIVDSALHCYDYEVSKVSSALVVEENQIFEAGRNSLKNLNLWMQGLCRKIPPSEFISFYRRRKMA